MCIYRLSESCPEQTRNLFGSFTGQRDDKEDGVYEKEVYGHPSERGYSYVSKTGSFGGKESLPKGLWNLPVTDGDTVEKKKRDEKKGRIIGFTDGF